MLTSFVNKYINERNNHSLTEKERPAESPSKEYVFGFGQNDPTSADAMSGMRSTRLSRYLQSRQSNEEGEGASPYLSAKYDQTGTFNHHETLS